MPPEMTVNWFDESQKEQQQDDDKISAQRAGKQSMAAKDFYRTLPFNEESKRKHW